MGFEVRDSGFGLLVKRYEIRGYEIYIRFILLCDAGFYWFLVIRL